MMLCSAAFVAEAFAAVQAHLKHCSHPKQLAVHFVSWWIGVNILSLDDAMLSWFCSWSICSCSGPLEAFAAVLAQSTFVL